MFSLKLSTIFVIISAWFTLENDAQGVFSEPAIFERLSHFKDAGLVNELNTVDQAMIADGTYRMLNQGGEGSSDDGYLLWHNRLATETVNNATKDLPPTEGPSRFVLTAHQVLPPIFPTESTKDDSYTCWGGGHNIDDMSNSMYNWHRAICAPNTDESWNGKFDPAYMPQQRALTIGFMCIIACDCNKRPTLSANSLREFAIDADHALAATAKLCGIVPWGEVDFHLTNSDTQRLADMSAPLTDNLCNCIS